MCLRNLHIFWVLSIAMLSMVAEARDQAGVMDVGTLIDQVVSGKDFSGKELLITGIALEKTGGESSLLNIGTASTYKSGVYTNFVSVYDVNAIIAKGSKVKIRALVENSSAAKLGTETFVTIETTFIECVSCRK